MATPMREFHSVRVDNNKVHLRVWLPPKKDDAPKKPAVVMVCGLLWLGQGLLGQIGLVFNDGFGRAFATAGAPCVQIHTPGRHLANTRLLDAAVLLLWPLGYFFWPRVIIILADIFFSAFNMYDLLILFLLPLHGVLGPFSILVLHAVMRLVHWVRGDIPRVLHRDHQKEIHEAVKWAERNQDTLGSNGKLVLCGYSSGGHCAALFGGSCVAPKFEAVVLISGVYCMRTHTWSGLCRFLAPIFNMVFSDILGLQSEQQRNSQSPEIMVRRDVSGQEWYVLSARSELMGLQPLQDILFQPKPLCDALSAAGAKVHRVSCGFNHWDLVLKISDFVGPFCAGL